MDTLPCGCHLGTDEETKVFYFEPCSLSCPYYLYMLKESERQSKPVITLDAR